MRQASSKVPFEITEAAVVILSEYGNKQSIKVDQEIQALVKMSKTGNGTGDYDDFTGEELSLLLKELSRLEPEYWGKLIAILNN